MIPNCCNFKDKLPNLIETCNSCGSKEYPVDCKSTQCFEEICCSCGIICDKCDEIFCASCAKYRIREFKFKNSEIAQFICDSCWDLICPSCGEDIEVKFEEQLTTEGESYTESYYVCKCGYKEII